MERKEKQTKKEFKHSKNPEKQDFTQDELYDRIRRSDWKDKRYYWLLYLERYWLQNNK